MRKWNHVSDHIFHRTHWIASSGLALLLSLGFHQATIHAQQPVPLTPPPDPAAPDKMPEASVKPLADGRLQIGKVILDKKERTLTLPAEVNMRTGVVEYFLVSKTGKLHESVLRTDVEPYHVHVAMLLLGAKAAMETEPSDFYDPSKEIPGDKISIEIVVKDGEVAKKVRAEEFVQNLESKKPMSQGPWAYNGSHIVGGTFVAQREGSFISLISDAYSLINNPRTGRENDEIWSADEKVVPPVNAAVEVIIHLP